MVDLTVEDTCTNNSPDWSAVPDSSPFCKVLMSTPHSTAEEKTSKPLLIRIWRFFFWVLWVDTCTCRCQSHKQATLRAQIFTLVGESRGPVNKRFERGTFRFTDESFDQCLDVVHTVLHCCKQHPSQETSIKERSWPGEAHTVLNERV